MIKYIAILRGINVGGKRRMKMADFRELLSGQGYKNVKTYIQSGNIIFEYREMKHDELEDELSVLIKNHYDYDVPVIVRTVREWKAMIEKNPYLKDSGVERLYVTFLKTKPSSDSLDLANIYDFRPDLFDVNNENVYIYCEGKYHKSKLTNKFFESKLKVGASTRNWKSILKIYELATNTTITLK